MVNPNSVLDYEEFGIASIFYGILDGDNQEGTDGGLIATEDSGMGRLSLAQDFTPAPNAGTSTANPGDNGAGNTFTSLDTGPINGSTAFGVFNGAFSAAAQDTLIWSDGVYRVHSLIRECKVLKPMSLVVNVPAKSSVAATLGQSGFSVTEYFNVTLEQTGTTRATSALAVQSYTPTFSERTTDILGQALAALTQGATQAWGFNYWSPNEIVYHSFVGDNIIVTLTLDYPVSAATTDAIQITEDGVPLAYTAGFTVVAATGVITFVAAPGDGVDVQVRYQTPSTC